MADYLRPVGRAWRITSIAGCTLAAVICLLVSNLLLADMIRRRSFNYEGKPLWLGAVALIGLAASFIALRLYHQLAAANGRTVLPPWFISLFGVLFLTGLGCVAYDRRSVLFLIDGVPACLTMIFVGRHIRKRQRLQ